MAQVAPPQYVEVTAGERTPYGLLDVASVTDAVGGRWQAGVELEPVACEPAGLVGIDCDTPADLAAELRSGTTLVTARPFGVAGTYDCLTVGRDEDDARQRALGHLLAGEGRAVERQVAAGVLHDEPSLVSGDDLTPVGGAVSPTVGLSLVERALGEGAGSRGVVHAPRSLVPFLAQQHQIVRSQLGLETQAGARLVSGGGYDLTDQSDTEGWLYGTGRVHVWRSEPFYTPDRGQIDKDQNRRTIAAQRVYVVAWECLTVRVRVTRTTA